MRYKLLGGSGLRVSELCLGTMTFGEAWGWGASKDVSRGIYDAFMGAGGNFIDTANVYTNGESEEFLGDFIAADRERVVLSTKYTNSLRAGDPNGGGNHRKSMVQSVEGSLRRLKTDYIDLLWLHIWDFMTPVEEVMRAFDDLVRAGKILYAGISDTPAWIVARANTLAGLRGWTPFVGLQVEYSLVERTPERELLPMARALDIGVTAWSPLASGLLTGKYNAPDAAESGAGSPPRLDDPLGASFVQRNERNLSIAAEVVKVAGETGHSPAQVALNWVRRKGAIPIIGARRLSQFQDNLACLDFDLSEEHVARLDEASRIAPGFPHEFFEKEIVRNFTYGGTFDLIENHRA